MKLNLNFTRPHAITYTNSLSDVGCGKDLAESEKILVTNEIAKVKKNESIAKRINRCVTTEMSESVRIWGKCFKEETSV